MEPAKLTIGGREITIPELNFKALKRIYPVVKRMDLRSDDDIKADPAKAFDAMDDVIEVISIALERSDTPMTPAEIEEDLTASELKQLQPTMVALLRANGLSVTPGERKPAASEEGAGKSSTETLMPSSAKSSQDLEPPTGI